MWPTSNDVNPDLVESLRKKVTVSVLWLKTSDKKTNKDFLVTLECLKSTSNHHMSESFWPISKNCPQHKKSPTSISPLYVILFMCFFAVFAYFYFFHFLIHFLIFLLIWFFKFDNPTKFIKLRMQYLNWRWNRGWTTYWIILQFVRSSLLHSFKFNRGHFD